MMKTNLLLIGAAFLFSAAGPLLAAEHSTHDMHGMAGHDMTSPALMEPVKTVFDDYLKVGAALVKDSFGDISEPAQAMVKAIQSDSMKMLPTGVAKQAQALAQAADLAGARKAFKPLSESLIKYLKDQNVPAGTYHEVYCPMAKASWLQADKTVRNPYLGKEMSDCGQVKS